MRIKRTEFIAIIITASIFGLAFSYIFDFPKNSPSFGDVKEWFSSSDESKESTPKPTKASKTQKSTSKKSTSSKIGKVVDTFNGVDIYYNGRVAHIDGRNVTADGYNLGLKYQCVEFVKRYYYEFYNHKMPDSYGNAKDFYSYAIEDGQINPARNLRQFSNPSKAKAKIGDILIFGPTPFNKFGHVGIISDVQNERIQIVQQNPGTGNPSRQWFPMERRGDQIYINHQYVLGYLRKS